tara:strand:- start:495 stop:1184 length:690 start_codon:yes stop_codon:yes gene_type:complete
MSRARDLSRLSNPVNFTVDSSTNNIGVNSTSPDAKLDVVGVVSATAFYGDGSNLEGVASAGLGTALGSGTNGLEVIYYTDKVLTVSDDITVDPPATTNIAYTQYSEIEVANTKDLIVADGDDLVPDILGLSTEGVVARPGAGGRIRADYFTNKAGTGAPTFQTGLNVTGNLAATGQVSGASGTFTGNVSVGGTLTYEDVTNVDSVGVITARSGIDDKSNTLIFDTWLYG